jgi:hypothetical protein
MNKTTKIKASLVRETGKKSKKTDHFRRWRLVIKEIVFIAWLQILTMNSTFAFSAQPKHRPAAKQDQRISVTHKELLKNSQISYRAEGGFTGVKSYSVIISCVDGRISSMSSIVDPNVPKAVPLRKRSTMKAEEYLALWDDLKRHQVFNKKDATNPRHDILDEFTVHFEAKVGPKDHSFKVFGCSRPEAAQYFALRNILDQAAGMKQLWETRERFARK